MLKGFLKYLVVVFTLVLQACGTSTSENQQYLGTWAAVWETDPAGYPGLSDQLDFTMSGRFLIEKDSITIEGYGYKGCIFTEDTIHHRLIWRINNDSLKLFNDPDTPGLAYKIIESESRKIRLQLEDIYVTLSK
tara:strand:+ start:6962 stop:7363 length:402 start_codon:yes stop_codon:yes gene_type:complete